MEQRGLIERKDDPRDRRRAHVALTQQGHDMMSTYLASAYRIVTVA